MRPLFFLSSLLLSLSAFGQFGDTIISGKLTNYDRRRTWNDHLMKWSYEHDKKKSGFGVMSRLIVTNRSDQLADQFVLVNGKKNGLAISFWASGIVRKVDYYFEDRLWETISRTDSTGKLLHPGTLVNGNGLVYTYEHDGKLISTTSYNSGYPTGPYSQTTENSFGINLYGLYSCKTCITEGNLAYKPSAVNYFPAFSFRYIDGKDTINQIIDTGNYYKVYAKKEFFPFQIIDLQSDSIKQLATEFYVLDMRFHDPAIIPTGKWRVFDASKNKELVAEIDHDDNGNTIHLTVFQNRKIVNEQKFPPCSKRKLPIMNEDGSFRGDSCVNK